jgi:hypothetical protein
LYLAVQVLALAAQVRRLAVAPPVWGLELARALVLGSVQASELALVA